MFKFPDDLHLQVFKGGKISWPMW